MGRHYVVRPSLPGADADTLFPAWRQMSFTAARSETAPTGDDRERFRVRLRVLAGVPAARGRE
jgi:hypothetical protein